MIILDLNLPDGNGIELLKWVKEKQIETQVYVFSTSIELKRLCLKYGTFAFFDKAKDFNKLIETLIVYVADILEMQAKAGADVLMIFDSWSHMIPSIFWKDFAINPTKKIIKILNSYFW